MPSVIDTLIVELQLDPKKFSEGQRQALDAAKKLEDGAERSGKNVEAHTKRMEEFFGRLKRDALALGAALVGGAGAKQFVDYITTMDATTGRLAKTMNMSTSQLSAWQGAAEQAGGSAQDITSTLQGLSKAVNLFRVGMGADLLGPFTALNVSMKDAKGDWLTASDLLLSIADSVEKVRKSDPALAAALLSQIPGMNQTSINMMLEGKASIIGLLEAARQAGVATAESSRQAQEYQKNLALLSQTATDLGRTITNYITAPLVEGMQKIKVILDLFKTDWKRAVVQLADPRLAEMIYGEDAQGNEARAKERLKLQLQAQQRESARSGQSTSTVAHGNPASGNAEVEAYIRKSAQQRGIDPEVAVDVWKSEGKPGYIGDRGSSFGPFQLHYGGIAGGGMAVSGLGDKFTKQTGLDARDRSTWKQQVDFALDEAKKAGWTPWHGWRGLPFQGIGARGAPAMAPATSAGNVDQSRSNSTSVTIHELNVNAPNAKDANGASADGIGEALRRQSSLAGSNYSLV